MINTQRQHLKSLIPPVHPAVAPRIPSKGFPKPHRIDHPYHLQLQLSHIGRRQPDHRVFFFVHPSESSSWGSHLFTPPMCTSLVIQLLAVATCLGIRVRGERTGWPPTEVADGRSRLGPSSRRHVSPSLPLRWRAPRRFPVRMLADECLRRPSPSL